MPQAGELRWRLYFRERVRQGNDGYGNSLSEFGSRFSRSAKLALRTGAEAVVAGRMQGQNTYEAWVRYDTDTRGITTDWVAKVDGVGDALNVKSAARDPIERGWIRMMLQSGSPS